MLPQGGRPDTSTVLWTGLHEIHVTFSGIKWLWTPHSGPQVTEHKPGGRQRQREMQGHRDTGQSMLWRGETETERNAGTQRRGPVYALKLTVKTKFVADSLFPSLFPSNPRGGDLDFSWESRDVMIKSSTSFSCSNMQIFKWSQNDNVLYHRIELARWKLSKTWIYHLPT